MSNTLIQQYYRAFNERRFADAAAFFADDADLELMAGGGERGGVGYLRFAESWTTAFPNAAFAVDRIEQRGASGCEVYLLASGTHRGDFEFGIYRFKPTGAEVVLHLRELLEICSGKIAASVLTVDVNDVVRQLTTVDYGELTRRLAHIRVLGDELANAMADGERRREITRQLGAELDAARQAVRPHFNR